MDFKCKSSAFLATDDDECGPFRSGHVEVGPGLEVALNCRRGVWAGEQWCCWSFRMGQYLLETVEEMIEHLNMELFGIQLEIYHLFQIIIKEKH